MTRVRFAELVESFRELPCGVCSEEFEPLELSEFVFICICFLNRDSLLHDDMWNLFESEVMLK